MGTGGSGAVDPARVLELLPAPVAVLALDGRLVEANAAFRDLLTVDGVALDGVLSAAQERLSADGVTDEVDVGWFTAPSGEDVVCQVRVVPARGSGADHFVVRVVDPPQAAQHDPLTGLAHRHLLLERLQHALARSQRSGSLVELVVIDLDDFKGVNDTLGHVVGDQVLVEVARRLRASVRPADTVCRWGGDEFVVLLEDPTEVGGHAFCHRVGEALAEPVTVTGGAPVRTGASCGWVRARLEEDAVALLHRADLQMYETKRARKNVDPARRGKEMRQRLARAQARARLLSQVNRTALAASQQELLVARAQAQRRRPRPELDGQG